MIDATDIEITLDKMKRAIIRVSLADGECAVPLSELVMSACEWLTADQLCTLADSLTFEADACRKAVSRIDMEGPIE